MPYLNINSTIFKEQLTSISTVLNNTGNTTQLLTSFNALDVAQQKVLLSSKLLNEEQKSQCATMVALSSVNSKYTSEQLTRVAGVSAETLANWGLVDSTDSLTIAELAELAISDKQAKSVLDKIIAQNAQAVANGEVTASNIALASSEGSATLATGAFTTAIKTNMKAMWTWMTTTPIGWLTLLATGVFAVVKAYDALTVSVEEQKEKMEESLSAYEDAKSELSSITTELETQEQAMDELLAKEKLTYAEKGQLEELQAITRELRIQKDLADKEEGRTEKQLARDSADLFNKQFGDYEISEYAINKYQNDADITGNNAILVSDENDISAMIAGYKQFNELLDEAYGSGTQDDIDHFKSLTEDLEDSIFTTAQELQTQQDNISAYYESIKDTPYEDLTTEQKEIVDTYNAISNAIALIYQQLDPNTWNSMQVDNIFSTEGIEKTKDELVAMAQSGELTPETINGYTNLNNALGETTLSAQDLCDELYAIADAQKEVQGQNPDETTIQLGISETIDELNTKLKPTMDSLASAWQNVFDDNGNFVQDNVNLDMFSSIKSELDSLNQEFGISIDGYEDLIRTLTDTETGTTEAKDAFDDFATSLFYGVTSSEMFNDETKNTIVQMMESLGITNALEIANQQLAITEESVALAEKTKADANELLIYTDSGVISSIQAKIQAYLTEAGATDVARLATFQLIAAEQIFSNTSLNCSQKIQELNKLASAYLTTAQSARLAAYTKGLEKSGMSSDEVAQKSQEYINQMMNESVKIDVDYDGFINDAKNAGSKAGKSLADAMEKELNNLDSVISAVGGLIDDQIDHIQDQCDNVVDSLEKERDAILDNLEDEKKALEDAVEAKQAQIDAIKDAREERNAELDLMRKEYELERIQNQRTRLVKYMPDTIVI